MGGAAGLCRHSRTRPHLSTEADVKDRRLAVFQAHPSTPPFRSSSWFPRRFRASNPSSSKRKRRANEGSEVRYGSD
ncbi:hypothetical protein RSOL_561680 [Rhizoctonia solani AG-3 Rhs1AP]|uniref:Uncharacterized protein n=1 Tax=Rhizoctonia solani AG-3 Rhs1AP TaxID=1086054 RepID=X8JWF9_9AGAM|nr:hypothetical protein RSOL_561680 [Rhizoctonia solani AG-3 Rhs1AP]